MSLTRSWIAILLVLLLVTLPGASPATGVAPPAHPVLPDAPYVADELLVSFEPTLSAAGIGQVLRGQGLSLIEELPGVGIYRVRMRDGSLRQTLTTLAQHPAVRWAEPNYILQAPDMPSHPPDDFVALAESAVFTPNDPWYPSRQKMHLDNLEMEAAWAIERGSDEIVVAVVDTGIQLDHPDLAGAIWQNPGEVADGADTDGNGFVDDLYGWDFANQTNDPSDWHGHGTHVAGTVGARINNNEGIAGMANVRLMAINIFQPPGIGTYAHLIQGIVYATDNGAHVINLSLGAVSYSRGEEVAVNYAWERDVVIVAAAGNRGNNHTYYPAGHANVMGVSATRSDDGLAGFSSWGHFVSVAAPGQNVWSLSRTSSYRWSSGTSMATPHVSGLAALILSRNSNLTNAEVRKIIESTADDLGELGWDPQYGHGRINAARALGATPLPDEPAPPREPRPPFTFWPEGCREVISGGDFAHGELGPGWEATGTYTVTDALAYTGDHSLRLAGVPGSQAEVWYDVTNLSTTLSAATLFFAYRIENQDRSSGPDPDDPFADRLRVNLRTLADEPIMMLLRTGNTADTAPDGLPWDEYLYAFEQDEIESLRDRDGFRLHFYADNNSNPETTTFYVDAVRLCMTEDLQRVLIPLVLVQ